ncbi:MAG: DUF4358 domain-containing protein [Firmicutes bacterium]|nr:DUF4358 domain-containing protein [Bacillota bacterium]
MKRLIVGILIVMMAFAVTACSDGGGEEGGGSEGTPVNYDFTAAELAGTINENVTFNDFMEEVDPQTVYELYGIDGSAISDSCTYFSTGATAEEISVMCVDPENADSMLGEINRAFNKRIDDQIESFTDYVPAELDKLKNPLIMEIGNSVVMVVCDDPDQAKTAILDFINQ